MSPRFASRGRREYVSAVELSARGDVELAEDAGQVPLDGAWADEKSGSDLGVEDSDYQ